MEHRRTDENPAYAEGDIVVLHALIELELDCTEAYEAALDRIGDPDDENQLNAFLRDHQRHVRELQALVVELGAQPTDKPDFERFVMRGKIELVGLIGDGPILKAMHTNEDQTNAAYDQAYAREDLPANVRAVLRRICDDERRHRAYMVERLATFEGRSWPGGAESPSSDR